MINIKYLGSTSQSYWLPLASPGPAVEADLDLAMTASLCFALLAAVLPNRPGEGDRLLVLEMNIWARDGQSDLEPTPPAPG